MEIVVFYHIFSTFAGTWTALLDPMILMFG